MNEFNVVVQVEQTSVHMIVHSFRETAIELEADIRLLFPAATMIEVHPLDAIFYSTQ